MTKMGAVLAAGILDAGGRNVTLGLRSGAGHKKMASIVGMAMFCQVWYWFPLSHFLSLAFTPTAIIGLNKDLQVCPPFACAGPQSMVVRESILALCHCPDATKLEFSFQRQTVAVCLPAPDGSQKGSRSQEGGHGPAQCIGQGQGALVFLVKPFSEFRG